MASSVNAHIHYNPESTVRAGTTLVKAIYLKRINKLLQHDPKEVITRMEQIRQSLGRFANFRVLVIADITKLERPVSSWDTLTASLDTNEPLLPLTSRKEFVSDAGQNPGRITYIIPMSTIDSSFAHFSSRGLQSHSDPKLPALMVALAYLDAVEGPMWVAVRGTGLAYGVNFNYNLETGIIGFRVYRSPDTFKAYRAARTVVEDFISGKTEFDKNALEGAISSIVVQFANEQTTMFYAAVLGFTNLVVKGIAKDWSQGILKKVRDIGVDDIKDVLQSLVLPCFTPGKANVVAACATIMQEVSTLYLVYSFLS